MKWTRRRIVLTSGLCLLLVVLGAAGLYLVRRARDPAATLRLESAEERVRRLIRARTPKPRSADRELAGARVAAAAVIAVSDRVDDARGLSDVLLQTEFGEPVSDSAAGQIAEYWRPRGALKNLLRGHAEASPTFPEPLTKRTSDLLMVPLLAEGAYPLFRRIVSLALASQAEGDWERAMGNLTYGVACISAYGEAGAPSLFALGVRGNVERAVGRTEGLLSRFVCDERSLTELQHAFQRLAPKSYLYHTLAGLAEARIDEVGRFHENARSGEAGRPSGEETISPDERGAAGTAEKLRIAEELNVLARAMTALADPDKQEGFDRLETFRAARTESTSSATNFEDAVDSLVEYCAIAEGLIAVAEVGIAVERYRLESEGWPPSLDVLVPGYIQALPADPFDGQPLRYVVGDRWRAVCAGETKGQVEEAPARVVRSPRPVLPSSRASFVLLDPSLRGRGSQQGRHRE